MNLAALSTIVSCERQLLLIAGSTDPELKIPMGVHLGTLGGEAALAQVLITWAQTRAAPTLSTHLSDELDPRADKLARRFYGLIGALIATRATGISEVPPEPLRAAALKQLALLQGPDPEKHTRGPSADIVCADHFAQGAPATLYKVVDGVPVIRDRTDFRALAQKLLKATAPGGYGAHLGPEMAEATGSLLYETFRNTEDHALTDVSGNVLGRSVRALRFSHLSPDRTTLSAMAEDFPALAAFCDRQRPPAGANQLHLLEFSILDSGPGYAQRLTGQRLHEMDPAQEREAVMRCFSVASSKRRTGFGQGLPHVVRLLREKGGFLRLRTGRLSLFADLGAPESTGPAEPQLEEWHLPGRSDLAAVSGTLLSIFVPLSRGQ